MANPTINHGSFTIERNYDAAPARVFRAWADPETKARWFIGPEGWQQVERKLDFRTGGSEILHGKFAHGPETRYVAHYYEVIAEERVVLAYDMHLSGKFHSVSLATVEFFRQGSGTKLVFTEQVAFLDGTKDAGSRERGTAQHLDRLAMILG